MWSCPLYSVTFKVIQQSYLDTFNNNYILFVEMLKFSKFSFAKNIFLEAKLDNLFEILGNILILGWNLEIN
jgi:hypothetical protein